MKNKLSIIVVLSFGALTSIISCENKKIPSDEKMEEMQFHTLDYPGPIGDSILRNGITNFKQSIKGSVELPEGVCRTNRFFRMVFKEKIATTYHTALFDYEIERGCIIRTCECQGGKLVVVKEEITNTNCSATN